MGGSWLGGSVRHALLSCVVALGAERSVRPPPVDTMVVLRCVGLEAASSYTHNAPPMDAEGRRLRGPPKN